MRLAWNSMLSLIDAGLLNNRIRKNSSLSVRWTCVCIQYSSYMKVSRIIMSERGLNVEMKSRTYNYGIRASFSCHDDPIRVPKKRRDVVLRNRYAYMQCSRA